MNEFPSASNNQRESLLQTMPSQQPVSWTHTIPSYMPWTAVPCNNIGIMRFTAETSHPVPNQHISTEEPWKCSRPHRTIYQYKRKGNHLDEFSLPNKVYISEEKMAQRLNELHISNRYDYNRQINSSYSKIKEDTATTSRPSAIQSLEQLEARLSDYDDMDLPGESKQEQPVLVLSPELKKIASEPIIPPTLLEKLKKPSMELVLWKPPGGIVNSLIKAVTSESEMQNAQNRDTQKGLSCNELNNSNNNNTEVSVTLNTTKENEDLMPIEPLTSNSETRKGIACSTVTQSEEFDEMEL